MGSVSFALPAVVGAAVVVALLQPLFLWLSTRAPKLKGRNPVQFLLSSLGTFAAYGLFLAIYPGALAGVDVAVGLLILVCANLLFLEAWALLSRGYTIGLLLTLLQADSRALTPQELAARYRGGDSIEWIMRHRLSGLIHARLVARDGDRLRLTRFPGLPVVWLYRLSIVFLGLRRTG